MLLDALEHLCFEQYAEDILNSFERWRRKEPLPENAPNKVSV
jgi:protein-tyrosine phosphatase